MKQMFVVHCFITKISPVICVAKNRRKRTNQLNQSVNVQRKKLLHEIVYARKHEIMDAGGNSKAKAKSEDDDTKKGKVAAAVLIKSRQLEGFQKRC